MKTSTTTKNHPKIAKRKNKNPKTKKKIPITTAAKIKKNLPRNSNKPTQTTKTTAKKNTTQIQITIIIVIKRVKRRLLDLLLLKDMIRMNI